MRRSSKPKQDRKKRKSCLSVVSVMDVLPTLASTVLSSTVSLLRESPAVQIINKRLNRRTMSSAEMCWPVPMRAIGAQNLLTMPGGVTSAGYLHKKGGSQFSLMKWPLRYIIIHKGCLYYFKSSTSPAPQGAFSLNGYNRVMRAAEETTSSNVFPFKIVHFSKKHRTWFFSAASEDERRKWMRYLRREIDHYNDRKEPHLPSDSDSDTESFYGSIEKPMDIKHPVDTTEDDYVDDDDDEEDYLKPDSEGSSASSGRPTGPPPSYPPPPVPATFPLRRDSSPSFQKGVPPPIPPQHQNPTSPLPKKPPPSVPPSSLHKEISKSMLSPPPFTPPPQKTSYTTPPVPPPPNSKKTLQSRTTSVGGYGNDRRDWGSHSAVTIHTPATLPICEQLETRLALNGPAQCPLTTGGTMSLGNNCVRSKPSVPLPQSGSSGGSCLAPNHTPLPDQPPLSLLLKAELHGRPGMPRPPPPTGKPTPPSTKPKPGAPFQRASPEGQSFRSLGDDTATEFRKKRNSAILSGHDESDDDYENVSLPDTVFIDSTETTFVEKLFRESAIHPQDGLYGIRNSGTKTAKVLVVWDVSINKARNYRLFEESDCIFLESDMTFSNLSHLIEHYYSHPLPHHSSLCLQKPYTKT